MRSDETKAPVLGTVNWFRKRRGARLRMLLASLSRELGRDLHVLDVGGRPAYWENVRPEGIARIVVVNTSPTELGRTSLPLRFETFVGDARDLSGYADGSFDVVHSNSVIEHVGTWRDMQLMAHELRRVGVHGWVQTPAWEFPIEPHHRLPFVHWLGAPAQRAALSVARRYRGTSISERREHVERINLLARPEVEALFPGCAISVERFAGLPKSYIATW